MLRALNISFDENGALMCVSEPVVAESTGLSGASDARRSCRRGCEAQALAVYTWEMRLGEGESVRGGARKKDRGDVFAR